MLTAEWRPIASPSAIAPLCHYTFPACLQLRPKDGTSLGSFLPPSLLFSPALSMRAQYSGAPQSSLVSVFVGSAVLLADMVCVNVTLAPQLQHAGYTLSVSISVW